MARVFVSYRRADGAYGVGWLAERLRSLDTITGVETAFHDAALRAGDDFPDALDAEIAGSDLVIAVIGPAWAGGDGDGPARIEDGRDLDTIVEHIESHLSDLDRDRARLAGLEEPVEVPRLTHLPALVTGAVVAAAVGGWLGAVAAGLLSPWPFGDVESVPLTRTGAYDWFCGLSVALGIAAGAFGVFGVAILVRLTRHVRLDGVRLALVFAAVGGVAIVLAMSTQVGDLLRSDEPPIGELGARLALMGALAFIGSAPWGACLVAPLRSTARAGEEEIGRRLQTLALLRDAERWGAISVAAVLTVATASFTALIAAGDRAGDLTSFEPVPNLGFATIISLLLILAHTASITRLRDQQEALERSLAGLPPRYRANALPRLVATTFDDGGWGFRILLALPAAVAVVATAAIAAGSN